MSVDLSISPQKTTENIVKLIKKTIGHTGFSRLVIGLSGGIDSAVTCTLAVKAIGARNIYIGLFPYGNLNKTGMEDARKVVKLLKIPPPNVSLVDIESMVDKILAYEPKMNNLRKGNIMARVRMILLFDLAKKHKALVLGTENKTEYLLGYFTRFGDEASDIEVLRGLYKTQVRQLAGYLEISEEIIKKSPSAGLWSGQTDEGEFGFSYGDADKILHLSIDKKKSRGEIIKLGFPKRIVDRVLKRMKDNNFKHKLPYVL